MHYSIDRPRFNIMQFGYLIFGLISIGYCQTYEEFKQTRTDLQTECEKVPLKTKLSNFVPSDGYLKAKSLVQSKCKVEISEVADDFLVTSGYFQNCYVLQLATALKTQSPYVQEEACNIYRIFGQHHAITGWNIVGRLLLWYEKSLNLREQQASVNTLSQSESMLLGLVDALLLGPLSLVIGSSY